MGMRTIFLSLEEKVTINSRTPRASSRRSVSVVCDVTGTVDERAQTAENEKMWRDAIFPRVYDVKVSFFAQCERAERSRWTVIPCNFVQLHEPKAQYLDAFGTHRIRFWRAFLLPIQTISRETEGRDTEARKSGSQRENRENGGPRKSSHERTLILRAYFLFRWTRDLYNRDRNF